MELCYTKEDNCYPIRGEVVGESHYADIAIIGGGASGIAAAAEAKNVNPAAEVLIAERLDKTGRKILATGNGRCNLSNKNITASDYHGSVRNIMQIIGNTPSAEELFASMGVLCTSDEQGRIYPYSNSAATVLNSMRLRLSELGVRELCGFFVKKLIRLDGGFILRSDDSEIRCHRLIIAAGGYAAPSFGTDGNMTRLLKDMGYRTAKICPAVAPLRVRPDRLKGLKGVRVKGKISAVSGERVLREELGEIQFTENSVSGICVFNLAYLFSKYEGNLTLRADLMPKLCLKDLEEYLLCVQSQRFMHTLEDFLSGIFVKSLAVYIMKNTLGRPLTDRISTLQYKEIRSLAERIKSLEFEVTGGSPWQNAQATSGGIHGECVDDYLESRLDRGMYFAGEILDVVGDCGGYNLDWAWSSGTWAGRSCAESLKAGG